MISGRELRKGIIIELDGTLYQVVDYQHVKMKRTALARVKLRDLTAGHTIERSFQSNDKLVRARLDTRPMQYLYNDGDIYHFMDTESFEQIEINRKRLGDVLNYLKESSTVEISNCRWLLSLRLLLPSPALKVIPPPVVTNRQLWKRGSPFKFRFSSMRAISSRSIRVPVNIWKGAVELIAESRPSHPHRIFDGLQYAFAYGH